MTNNARPSTGEIGASPGYKPLSVEEVRQIAMDLLGGQIFGSWQIPKHDQHLLHSIFMPLMFLDELTLKEWQRDKIEHVYGHMKDTVSRSMYGYPIFHSFRPLNLEDTQRIVKMAQKMKAIMEKVEEENGEDTHP